MACKRQRVDDGPTQPACSIPSPNSTQEPEKQYFDSYGHLGIHEAMIRDTVRTEAYYNAILQHRHLFDGKVIIDVGCGTGILSIFCAWAGARKVYGIEASAMATQAQNVVQENGLDHIITVVQGKVEDITLQDEDGEVVVADTIVSEWMGYFLFYESMLESVLLARDKWLAPGGVMFPTHAALFLAPLTDDQYYGDRVFFWRSVYGASMSCLFSHAKKCSFDSVIIDTVHPFQCFSNGQLVKFVDCRTCSIKEVQEWRARFHFKSTIVTNFHGFVGYFAVYFAPDSEIFAHLGEKAPSKARSRLNPPNPYAIQPSHVLLPAPTANDENPNLTSLSTASHLLWSKIQTKDAGLQELFTLSTSPEHQTTHWQHSLFFTSDQLLMVQDQELEGMIEVGQNKDNRRFLDITIHWTIKPPPVGQPPIAVAAPTNNHVPVPRGVARPPYAPKPVGGYACDGGYSGYGHGFGYAAQAQRGVPLDGTHPDVQNQIEEDNPPQRPEFRHSKTFGFK